MLICPRGSRSFAVPELNFCIFFFGWGFWVGLAFITDALRKETIRDTMGLGGAFLVRFRILSAHRMPYRLYVLVLSLLK